MNPTITVRTRSYDTSTSRTATRAEDTGRRYGVDVAHDVQADRYDRRITHHTVTLTGDRTVLEMLVPELETFGIRPRISDDTGRGLRHVRT